jgi:hypothetical protein
MPLSEYILLALLATGGAALPDGSTSAKTLGADALAQPNGGAMSSAYLGQDPPKKDDIHAYGTTPPAKRLSKTRHGHKGKIGRHRLRTDMPKKDGGKRSGNL